MRGLTYIFCGIDAAIAFAILFALFSGLPDPATSDLDRLAGTIVLALLLLTAAPAVILAARARAPKTALALAAAFPLLLAVLVVAAVLML